MREKIPVSLFAAIAAYRFASLLLWVFGLLRISRLGPQMQRVRFRHEVAICCRIPFSVVYFYTCTFFLCATSKFGWVYGGTYPSLLLKKKQKHMLLVLIPKFHRDWRCKSWPRVAPKKWPPMKGHVIFPFRIFQMEKRENGQNYPDLERSLTLIHRSKCTSE